MSTSNRILKFLTAGLLVAIAPSAFATEIACRNVGPNNNGLILTGNGLTFNATVRYDRTGGVIQLDNFKFTVLGVGGTVIRDRMLRTVRATRNVVSPAGQPNRVFGLSFNEIDETQCSNLDIILPTRLPSSFNSIYVLSTCTNAPNMTYAMACSVR